MAQSAFSAECEAITSAKVLQTPENLITRNKDFGLFDEKYKCKPHTSVHTYKIDTKEYKVQWNARTIRKRRNGAHEQFKLHYTSRTHTNTTHLPHPPLYPHLSHLPSRISGQGREETGQGWTSDAINATLTRLFALTLLISDIIERKSASVKHLRHNQQSDH